MFAAGTGLRPEEWIALERRDVDRERRIVSVQRVYTNGRSRSTARRTGHGVGCRSADVCSATLRRPARPARHAACSSRARVAAISTSTTSANDTGSPALRAAGLEYRRPYDLRHTYATFSIAAGISLFALARRMGTSLQMIDQTYGHLAPDADDYELGLLDAFDAEFLDGRTYFGHGRLRPSIARSERKGPSVQGLFRDAPGTIRTCDLCLRRAALYPLSYGRGEGSV